MNDRIQKSRPVARFGRTGIQRNAAEFPSGLLRAGLLVFCAAISLRAADPAAGTIDLPTALRLAGASNLEVELAKAGQP